MYTMCCFPKHSGKQTAGLAVSLVTISSTYFSGSCCKWSSGWWASLIPFLCISIVLLPLAHFHTTTIKLIPLFSGHQKNSSGGLAKALPCPSTQPALERTVEDWKLLLSKRKFKYFVSVSLHRRPGTASEWQGTTAKTHMPVKHLLNPCMTVFAMSALCENLCISTLITNQIT